MSMFHNLRKDIWMWAEIENHRYEHQRFQLTILAITNKPHMSLGEGPGLACQDCVCLEFRLVGYLTELL